uniref:(northern house mosquito) hypothetical protein n=1 Tax=Culex pipiens TaxID=7175 RepID=A0A8D8ETX2_CULPI
MHSVAMGALWPTSRQTLPRRRWFRLFPLSRDQPCRRPSRRWFHSFRPAVAIRTLGSCPRWNAAVTRRFSTRATPTGTGSCPGSKSRKFSCSRACPRTCWPRSGACATPTSAASCAWRSFVWRCGSLTAPRRAFRRRRCSRRTWFHRACGRAH